MTTLTGEQENLLNKKIESLRKLDGKKAVIKNDAVYKLLCTLNANGFIDGAEFERWDRMRYEAFTKARRIAI